MKNVFVVLFLGLALAPSCVDRSDSTIVPAGTGDRGVVVPSPEPTVTPDPSPVPSPR